MQNVQADDTLGADGRVVNWEDEGDPWGTERVVAGQLQHHLEHPSPIRGPLSPDHQVTNKTGLFDFLFGFLSTLAFLQATLCSFESAF